MEIMFWASVGIIVYVYLAYPALIFILAAIKRNPPKLANITPSVTIIIAAHNEEEAIAGRVENCLAQRYPLDKLEIMVASDGSTDRTNEIAGDYQHRYANVKLLAFTEWQGRAIVHDYAAREARGEILVFTDAETRFAPDCLQAWMQSFADPKVGCVSAQVRYVNTSEGGVSWSEGLYARWEFAISRKESDLGVAFSGFGPCFAVRRELYETIAPEHDIDDVLPLRCRKRGYRVVHEPGAICYDRIAVSQKAGLRRRIRMSTQGMGATMSEIGWGSFSNPLALLHVVSRRLLRWWTPFFMIAAFASNLFLLGSTLYQATLLLQLLFYCAALIGALLNGLGRKNVILSLASAFCLANIAFLVSSFNLVTARKVPKYVPTSRHEER